MKNKKLNLKEISIKSFVTTMDNGAQLELKGGSTETVPAVCPITAWCDPVVKSIHLPCMTLVGPGCVNTMEGC